MPRSVSPEPPTTGEDTALPDAPGQPADKHSNQVTDGTESGLNTPLANGNAEPPSSPPKNNLEDMFDDDEDDEYTSSAPQPKQESSQEETPLTRGPNAGYSDPQIMRAFYQRLFPFRYLYQWLNHSPTRSNDFCHREFAFTLPNDAYLRYQSFPTADDLRKQCIHQIPTRFEIGPVYSTNPRDRKSVQKASNFRPISKELVFDIDMTDYDEIRTCCTGASICHRCWAFITMAIKVVDAALREDFGFKHILWVYSGRRGAHAWVCDKRAREMDDNRRRAIAGYLELLRGGDKSGKKVNVKRPLHPHLQRSLDLLRDHFSSDILESQDPWVEDEKAQHLLNLLPDKTLKEALAKKWSSAPGRSSGAKWSDIDTLASLSGNTGAGFTGKALLEAKQDIVLEYTYPRLDAEVSKKLNHLLKSPFVIHPGTGRVCVPIDPRKAEEFDPLSVPTVTGLLGEIEEWDRSHPSDGSQEPERRVLDFDKTSLKPYVDHFRGFVAALLKDEKGVKREREGDEMELW